MVLKSPRGGARRDAAAPRTKASAAVPRPSRIKLFWRRQRALLRPALLGVTGLLALGLITMGVLAADPAARLRGVVQAISHTGPGFTVTTIQVEGHEYTPRPILEAALGVRPGDATLGFDPAAARARLEASAWIAAAHVERRLPGTIIVRLTERRAFAVWQRDGRFSIIDRDGAVMQSDNLGAFGPLPLVVGAGANEAAAGIIDLLRAQPAIAGRVEAAVRVSERRWNLKLTQGPEVLLPEGHEAAAIARLAELQGRERLLDRPLAAIDMRLPDRLVLRPQGLPAAAPTTPVRSTRG